MKVHFLDDLERILTSEPASPPLAPQSTNEPCSVCLGYMVGVMVVDGPLRNFSGFLGTWYLVGLICLQSLIPNPQNCDTDCSQSREWGHQGCLGHFQEGQNYQVQGLRRVILRAGLIEGECMENILPNSCCFADVTTKKCVEQS